MLTEICENGTKNSCISFSLRPHSSFGNVPETSIVALGPIQDYTWTWLSCSSRLFQSGTAPLSLIFVTLNFLKCVL